MRYLVGLFGGRGAGVPGAGSLAELRRQPVDSKKPDGTAIKDILERSVIFGDLSHEHLAQLAGMCRPFSFAAGAVVFREGEEANELYVLDDGRVVLDIDVPCVGGETTPSAVETLGPADSLGWSSFVDPRKYRATARCVNPSTGVVIPADALLEAMEDDTALGYQAMRRLAQTVTDYLGHTRLRLTTQVVRLLDRKDW